MVCWYKTKDSLINEPSFLPGTAVLVQGPRARYNPFPLINTSLVRKRKIYFYIPNLTHNLVITAIKDNYQLSLNFLLKEI